MKAAMSEQNLRAVTVFPVPTLPERNAVHDRPSRAIGRNKVSSLPICSSRWIRSLGMYAKSRTEPSRMMAEAFSNMRPQKSAPSRNAMRPSIMPILADFSALCGSLNTMNAQYTNTASARTTR